MKFPVDAIKGKKILIIGDVMLDRYWFGEVDRISPEAPVPIVKVARREDRLGGAANVARNIVSLGAQASLIGIIGDDSTGKEMQQLAQSSGIAPYLICDSTLHTTLKMRILGRQQQLLRIDFEEQPATSVLTQVLDKAKELISQHDVLVLSDYAKGVLNNIEPLIAYAKASGIPILVDPKGDQYDRYKGASLVTPNRSEMQQAVGAWSSEEDLERRATKLKESLDLQALLVTRSEQGMTLFAEDGRHHVNAQAHEVFDVSGAGDTVLATLAVTRAAGLPWDQAMAWANKAGGVVVGKLGTSTITADELADI